MTSIRTKVKPPISLSYTLSATSGFAATVQWNARASAWPVSYYVLYRKEADDDGDYAELANSLTAAGVVSYRDATALEGVRYQYAVAAVNVHEIESAPSEILAVNMPSFPVWQTGWSLSIDQQATASVASRCVDPDGGSLTYARNGGNAPAGVTVNSAGLVATNAAAGGAYTLGIRASNASLSSDITASLTVIVPIVNVQPPTAFSLSAVSSIAISASWVAPTSGPAPTAYQLDRALTGTGNWTNAFQGLALGASDVGLEAETTYDYRLRSLDGVNASSFVTKSVTTPPASSATEFPLFEVYSAFVTARGGSPIPQSNTRYWSRPTYPSTGTVYASISALNAAIAAASSGAVLRLAAGNYANATITIGTAGVTVVANTLGGCNLTGNSNINVTAANVSVFGFDFTGPINDQNPLIQISASDTVICDCLFDISRTSNSTTANIVRNAGLRNRVCYCTVDGFNGSGRFVHNTAGTSGRYQRVDHNRVLDMVNTNTTVTIDNEVVQIGQNQTGTTYFGLTDNNYVYRWNNNNGADTNTTETEQFTFKSDANMAIRNVFEQCNGCLTLRHGDYCLVFACFWIGGGFTVAGGVRINGDGHIVACCYGEDGCSGGNVNRAFIILNGATNTEVANGTRYPAINNQVAFNSTYNWRKPIRFQTPSSGPEYPPEDNAFYNNAIDKYPSDDAIAVANAPADGNTTWNSDLVEPTVGRTASGLVAGTPAFTLVNGVRIPTVGGNCAGTATTGYSSLIQYDILGNPIPVSGANRGCFQQAPTENPWHAIRDAAGQGA